MGCGASMTVAPAKGTAPPAPAVESFSSFVLREVTPNSSERVRGLVSKLASCYINGRSATTESIDVLSDVLSQEGKIAGESEKDIFGMDMESCLQEIIYEYLAHNWNNMDALIKANAPSDEENSIEEMAEEMSVGKLALQKLKKRYTQKKIMDDLAHVRAIMTMTEIMRSVNVTQASPEVKQAREVLFKAYPPTIVFLGGGMGAGKSTVVSLLKETGDGIFADNPLVIEADALKMIDPVFKKLNEVEKGSNEISQIVHGHSIEAANKQLLVALANQRTIVMDGTMTWMPYVQQTINMVRSAHKFQYVLGPGYRVNDDGTTTEQYWDKSEVLSSEMEDGTSRLPYKVEMVGVTVDPEKAVARGLRRKLITSRGVPVRGQLRSHRLYSENFEPYLGLFDKVTLYDTSGPGDPQLVAMKQRGQPLLQDVESYKKFMTKKTINDGANGVEDMYGDGTKVEFQRAYWSDVLKKAFA